MRRSLVLLCAGASCALLSLPAGAAGQVAAGSAGGARPVSATTAAGVGIPALAASLDTIAAGLKGVEASAASGRLDQARQLALRLYLDRYEMLESAYGAGSGSPPRLAAAIGSVEDEFHQLLRAADAESAVRLARALRGRVLALRPWAAAAAPAPMATSGLGAGGPVGPGTAERARAPRSAEVRAIVSGLDRAEA